MSHFTYEQDNTDTRLETYEWDSVWWEQTGNREAGRVLYIGDSISCRTREAATRAAGGRLLFDGFGTSKALDNPYLFESVRLFARQEGERCAVLFNSGLHGWHLDDATEYPAAYEAAVRFLLSEFPETPLFLLLTTSVANAEREARVRARNAAVLAIAERYGLPVIDLYTVSADAAALRAHDGVHYTPEGYALFGECLARELLPAVTKEKA